MACNTMSKRDDLSDPDGWVAYAVKQDREQPGNERERTEPDGASIQREFATIDI